MAVTAKLYGLFFTALATEEHSLLADTIKVALTTSAYVYDQDAHNYYNDVTNEFTTTGGYTAGGATLANDTITYTGGTNVWKYDADDTVWSASTITNARVAVIYNATGGGSDATRGLIAYMDFGADTSSSAGDFTIAWNASGIFTITVG